MKEIFDRAKDRKTMKLNSNKFVELHDSFARKFTFKFDFHPYNLAQMIYPYQGYLAGFPNTQFSFEQLMMVYRFQLVSSFERY